MRRLFCPNLQPGLNPISADQAHHARTVLRLEPGETVELFDQSGQSAQGVIRKIEPDLLVEVTEIRKLEALRPITVASAVPKGDRADWMVEKLSEIGVTCWIPLKTARSVVHPDGKSKYDRWQRLATESAKQCRRSGVMKIAELVEFQSWLKTIPPKNTIYLSTASGCSPLNRLTITEPTILLIGPEGGWTPEEENLMKTTGLTPASLGPTILRIETAALVSAGIVALL